MMELRKNFHKYRIGIHMIIPAVPCGGLAHKQQVRLLEPCIKRPGLRGPGKHRVHLLSPRRGKRVGRTEG